MKKIINLYVEVKNPIEYDLLMQLLDHNDYAVYDATAFDPYTSGPNKLDDLLEIEATLELK